MVVVTRFPVQEADLEQPDEMKTHQHDGKAGNGGCHIHLITEDRDREADDLPERLAKHRSAGPSVMKTVENPSTKHKAAKRARRCWETEAPSPSDSSSSVAPVMKHR